MSYKPARRHDVKYALIVDIFRNRAIDYLLEEGHEHCLFELADVWRPYNGRINDTRMNEYSPQNEAHCYCGEPTSSLQLAGGLLSTVIILLTRYGSKSACVLRV